MRFFRETYNSLKELNKAYRKLALIHHPDAGGKEDDFKELSREYSRLKTSFGKRPSNTNFEYTVVYEDGPRKERTKSRSGANRSYFSYQGKAVTAPIFIDGMRRSVFEEIKRLWILAGNYHWNPYTIYYRYVHFILSTPGIRMLDIKDFYCLNSIFNYKPGWCHIKLKETRDIIFTDHGIEIPINEEL